jgi:hypothetical protein
MGHLYPSNISKYLLYKMYENNLEKDYKKTGSCNYTDKPRPLSVAGAVNHFMKKINRMQFAMKYIEENNDLIFSEDIEKQEKALKLLQRLTEQEFGCNAADGSFLEPEMIEMAVSEVLSCWLGDNIVYKKDKNWYLNLKCLTDKDLKDYIIEYIDM